MCECSIIVKVIKLGGWHWQGVIGCSNYHRAVADCEAIAPFQYPNAEAIFVIPIFLN